MNIIESLRSYFTKVGVFLCATLAALTVMIFALHTGLTPEKDGGLVFSTAVVSALIFGILGAILGRYATKPFIRSFIKSVMEELESDIKNHSTKAEQELLECGVAAEEARLKLERLPVLQAELLAARQKKLAEAQEALASLK